MSGEGSTSTFNEALGQMKRLHELQDRVNWCNVNLLLFDYSFNKYHYEIKFETVLSLMMEASSKMKDTELTEAKKLRDDIEEVIATKEIIYWVSEDNGVKRQMLRVDDWKKLKKDLFDFELTVRKYLDDHGLTSPKAQDPSKAIYR